MADQSISISVFSDPVCPWCLVGLHRLDAALERAGLTDGVEIVHQPFLLDANTPEGGEDVVEMLKRKYGRAPDEMWDRLDSEAKASGLDLDMRKQTRRDPSVGAHILIQMAQGSPLQHKVAVEIGRACYVDALNISDPQVLAGLGAKLGIDAENIVNSVTDLKNQEGIKLAASKAAEMGVSGVPLFVFNNEFALSGCQQDGVFDDALKKAAQA